MKESVQVANEKRCEKCKKRFTAQMVPLLCHTCKGEYHKAKKCSKLTRVTANNITKWNRRWICNTCKNPSDQDKDSTTQGEDEDGMKCMAVNCENRAIRKRTDHLKCTKCDGRLHKKEDCSEMTRGQLLNLDRNTWICDGCKGIKARKDQQKQDTPTVYKMKAKGKGIDKLKIVQWNADAYLSKKEDFSRFILEQKIDIYLIQETKITIMDKRTPQIPGFTVCRQDCNQRKGKERNRGGGLVIGCRDTIPCRVVERDYQEEGDELTEAMTIEVPVMGNKSIKIVNMYIPPIRNTSGEVARDRGSHFGTNRWPSSQDDIILGDVNAHSSMWDEAVKKNPRLGNDRGAAIEEWMMDNDMVTLNDGSPTHFSRSSGTESAPDVTIVHA